MLSSEDGKLEDGRTAVQRQRRGKRTEERKADRTEMMIGLLQLRAGVCSSSGLGLGSDGGWKARRGSVTGI